MLSTDKQTDKLTKATKNITSFAKEVKITFYAQYCNVTSSKLNISDIIVLLKKLQ